MKDVVNLNTTRCSMLKNFIMYHLSKTPSLISFLIIIPLVLYFFGEVSLSDDISYISLNPNFSDLINSYSVFFFRLLYLIIIITAPIYIFLSKIHIKSYYKYCRLNITFKSICNANYYLFISLFDLVTLIVFSFILFHTGSTLSAIFVFLCKIIPSMTLMILILSYCYQISLVLAIKFLNKVNISILELFIVLLYSLCSISIIENLSFSFVMNIPFYIIFIILFVLFFIMKFLYSKTPIETIVMANQKKKEKKIIKINGSMSIMNNYFLLLFSMKDIYLEYIVTFFILLVVILNTELSLSLIHI